MIPFRIKTQRYCDELYTLDRAVSDMHLYLTEQEEYKNQMYQNISHDFKTPITVIKSYIEASEDGIMTEREVMTNDRWNNSNWYLL